MDSTILGIVIGAVLVLLVTRAWPRSPRPAALQRGDPAPAGSPAEDPPHEDPSGEAPAPPPPFFEDPFLERLYLLENAVANGPQVTTPDDLLRVAPFLELVEALSAPQVDAPMLMGYAGGSHAVMAWAALAALARRPRDPGIEERLLGRVSAFHPWSRSFVLRVLEAWCPDDPALAGRVLLRLDPTWDHDLAGPVLDDFLRRRARTAPPTLEGLERPVAFDADVLQGILRHWVDPVVGRPILLELGDTPPRAARFDGSAHAEPRPGPATLEGIGRVTRPGKMTSEGVLACPSADAQLERVLAALAGTPHRSVLIVGERGVGKSSLIRRIAARLSQQDWTLFEAGAAQLNAGMVYIGSIEGRLQGLIRTLSAQPRTLWVCPDFQQLLWAGRTLHSPVGILEMLLPALEPGGVRVLGEVRPEALEKVLVERPEVARLFEIVRLEAPSESETAGMLEAWAGTVTGAVLPATIRREASALARQYLVTEPAPGGDLRLLREALGHALRREPDATGARSVTMDDLVRGLANLTGLPLDVLDERCPLDLDAVRRRFESHVMGQAEAVDCLVERLALLKAGVTDPRRPIGVFLFAGRSGTGKTELARTLAAYLFGSPERLERVDMSELQDPHALERLLGDASPVASRGNSLAERVRRQPFSVVLLDEFDRAHPRVWDVFLQVFDAGRLTDHRGDVADFRHTLIILTSNLGSASGEMRLGLTDTDGGTGEGGVRRAVERAFRPELLNRLDRVVVFRPLTRDVMRQILRKEMTEAFARRGLRRRDWAVEMEESAIELLVERGFSPTLGARPLKRALERLLLAPLAEAIVDRSAPAGDQFLFVRADGDALHVEFVDPDAVPAPAAVSTLAGAAAAPGAGDVASILFEAHGEADELAVLRAALEGLERRVGAEAWTTAKRDLLLESAAPGFWERADRFERLGRVEYMDRIENTLRSAASLLERLQGDRRTPRRTLPREMVRRLAQQLYLLEAASCEAVELGPRDAFVSIEPSHDDAAPPGDARAFALRIAAMYEAWARERGMRLAVLSAGEDGGPRLLAIAGFAACRLLTPESGLHVLESDEAGGRSPRRFTVRVRVEPQPPVPARDGVAALRRQAEEALATRGAPPVAVVRRYREKPSPLVRDLVRGWRTGRIERVLGGDFDVVPLKG